MSKRLSYERYLWFHRRVKEKSYPKLAALMEEFELSRRQAAREIEHMRLFFNAPIEYSAQHRGYYYSDHAFEFPSAMIAEEELISLIIAKRLSVTIPDQRRKTQLDSFFHNLSASFDLDVEELEKKISLKNIRYYRVKPETFDTVLQGLSTGTKLDITYHSVYTGGESRRIINPLHLILYMGNWHIIAYCEQKQGLRDFALSRITAIQRVPDSIDEKYKAIEIKEQIDEAYGIFFEGERKQVILKFAPSIAEFVREQVWFHGQLTEEDPQTRALTLTFWVTDFREVSREVMRFGAEVEVIEPLELRLIMKKNIAALCRIYL